MSLPFRRGIAKIGEPNNLLPLPPGAKVLDPIIHATLRRKQRRLVLDNQGVLMAVVKGAKQAILECQYQFRNRRWNCSTRNFIRGKNLFGKIVDRGESPAIDNNPWCVCEGRGGGTVCASPLHGDGTQKPGQVGGESPLHILILLVGCLLVDVAQTLTDPRPSAWCVRFLGKSSSSQRSQKERGLSFFSLAEVLISWWQEVRGLQSEATKLWRTLCVLREQRYCVIENFSS